MDAELLRQYLEFYRDLGIQTLYKRDAPDGESLADARGSDEGRDREGALSATGKKTGSS